MALNIDEILELKKYLKDNNAKELHLHDACAGQCFTLDTPDKFTIMLIKAYFKEKNIKASFSDNNDAFTIGGLFNG